MSSPLFRNAVIRVMNSHVELPLYVGGQQQFNVWEKDGLGYMLDIMTLKLSSTVARDLAGYGAFDVDQIVEARIGETVTAYGYPGIENLSTEVGTLTTTVADLDLFNIAFSHPSQNGLSGGFVLSASGLVGMIHGDRGTPDAMYSGLAMNFAFLRDELFGNAT